MPGGDGGHPPGGGTAKRQSNEYPQLRTVSFPFPLKICGCENSEGRVSRPEGETSRMADLDIVDEAAAAFEQLDRTHCSMDECSRTGAACMVDEILGPLCDNPIIAAVFDRMRIYYCDKTLETRSVN